MRAAHPLSPLFALAVLLAACGGDPEPTGGAGGSGDLGSASSSASASSASASSASASSAGGGGAGGGSGGGAGEGGAGEGSDFEACRLASGLDPSAQCAPCGAVVGLEACTPDHLCAESAGLYLDVHDCVCAPDGSGACAAQCPETCAETGDDGEACSSCAAESCTERWEACLKDGA